MIYVEAPQWLSEFENRKSLFLAGGITGVQDWQVEAKLLLQDTDLIVFNPRRAVWDITDKDIAKGQIIWENHYLDIASAILFWFSNETVQPITLFELGKWYQHKQVFIGVHPEYTRKFDVEVQVGLDRKIPIVYELSELIAQVKNWIGSEKK
jgi:hypothetical protein